MNLKVKDQNECLTIGHTTWKLQFFIHALMGIFIFALTQFKVFARSPGLSPYQTSSKGIDSRKVAAFVPQDDFVVAPNMAGHWYQNLVTEDKDGILVGIKQRVQSWQVTEEYEQQWGLESTGLYRVENDESQKRFLRKNALKYLDKRLSGEIKDAEKGSTMYSIGEVKETLSPNSKIDVAPDLRIRFKGRALQGKAMMIVENPYVDAETNVKLNGEVNIVVGKNLKDIGVKTEVRYVAHDGDWVASVDKEITDKISTRFSSLQNNDSMLLSSESDSRVELLFNQSF